MSALFIYSIKSVFVLAVLYVPYTLMLHRESFFRFNRFTLLAILVLSLVLPLCVHPSCCGSVRTEPVRPSEERFVIGYAFPMTVTFVAAVKIFGSCVVTVTSARYSPWVAMPVKIAPFLYHTVETTTPGIGEFSGDAAESSAPSERLPRTGTDAIGEG